LFEGNYYVQCKDLNDKQNENDYTISEECSINAVYFDKKELAKFIATNKIKDFTNDEVEIIWNDGSSVVLQGITEKLWNETNLKAKFTGTARIVWIYDSQNIIDSIIGQNKTIISDIIENNKNSLLEIQSKIRPMWKNTFPGNTKKIKIIDTVRDNIEE
jgi:accessory colonization factor AcfC